MQKKIIALAVAGLMSGAAFAQSNVTVSGTLGISYDSYSLSGPTTARTTHRQTMVNDQSSAIIFRGEENLGGGNAFWFQVDSRLSMDRGLSAGNAASNPYMTSGLGNGNTAMGLKGSWGTFGAGRWDVHYDAFAPIESYTAAALAARVGFFGVMAAVNGSQIALGSRASNLLFYVSPTFNGFKVTAGWSPNAAGGEGEANNGAATDNGNPGNGQTYSVKLNYDNGPINAVYSYFNHKTEGRGNYSNGWALSNTTVLANTPTVNANPAPADQISNRLGVAYTFPMGLKVGLAWDRSERRNLGTGVGDQKRTAWMLPVKYTVGNHDINFTYAKAGDTSNVVGDTKAKQFVLGYGYNLSKRSSVGVQYIKLTNAAQAGYAMINGAGGNAGLTTPTAGEDAKLLTFGMRHTF